MATNTNSFFFGMLIFINIAIFYFWLLKPIPLKNINKIKWLFPHFFLCIVILIAKVPFSIIFMLVILNIFYCFYKIYHSIGRAWLLSLVCVVLISASLFLRDDLMNYLKVELNILESSVLEIFLYSFLLIFLTFADKKYYILKYLDTKKKGHLWFLSIYTILLSVVVTAVNFFLDRHFTSYFLVISQIFIFFMLSFASIIYIINLEGYMNKVKSDFQLNIDRENYYQELDGFRHDFKAILFSLYTYVEEKKFLEMKNILDDISQYSFKAIDNNQLLNINDIPLRSMINNLQIEAEEKNIDLKLSIPEKVTFGNIEIFDLIRLMFIIINNAMEASEKEKTSISLSITNESRKHIQIICKNKIASIPTSPIEHLFQRSRSTKDGHQGIGLANFVKIADQYKNLFYNFEVNTQEYEFIVTIDILH